MYRKQKIQKIVKTSTKLKPQAGLIPTQELKQTEFS
jgi:hypothetical protein